MSAADQPIGGANKLYIYVATMMGNDDIFICIAG